MFCRLKFKNTDITNKCDVLKSTFAGILTGTITQASQLSDVLWDKDNSEIIEGSYGTCSWEVFYQDNYNTILRKESTIIPGKYKYIGVRTPDYPTNSHMYLETGNGFSTNTLTNVIHCQQYYRTENANNRYAYVSASNDFFVAASFGHEAGNFTIMALSEGFNWPYEQYALEGRMKMIRINGVVGGINVWDFAVSNQYNVQDNSYRGPVYNGNRFVGFNTDYNAQIPYTKEADLTTDTHILVPFVPRMLEYGWAGGNMSKICGLYLGTSIVVSVPTVISIGEHTYQLIRPYPDSSAAFATFYLRQ